MMIDRRDFVAGVALVAIAPALPALPIDAAVPALNDVIRPVFMIRGWSPQNGTDPESQLWIRVGHGWRTVWR
jgi:hypothetical protein